MYEDKKWVPIAQLSPCNAHWGLQIVLKVYFDASGKVNVGQDRYVTLAAMSATPWRWRVFEWKWQRVLHQKGAPFSGYCSPILGRKLRYFHTVDAIAYQEGFRGWNYNKVKPLIDELFNLISASAWYRRFFPQPILSFVCTVDKTAHEVFAVSRPQLPSVEQICLDHCLGLIKDDKRARSGLELYWDRHDSKSEPYYQRTREFLDDDNKDRPEWVNWVYHNAPVEDSKMVYPIQAVDFLAWSANRYFANDPNYKWAFEFVAMYMGLRHIYALYDDAGFDAVFDEQGNYKPRVKIPQPSLRFPDNTELRRRK